MRLSVKSDYATRAVLGLARRYPRGLPCRVEDLALEQGVPPKYLVQILLDLKAKRLVQSRRGKDGGYQLARPPAEITFGDVLSAIEGEVVDAPALKDPRCPPELGRVWQSLRGAAEAAAAAITFQRLVDEGVEKERMYYI